MLLIVNHVKVLLVKGFINHFRNGKLVLLASQG